MIPKRSIKRLGLLVVCAFLLTDYLGAQKLIDSISTYYYSAERDSIYCLKHAYEYNDAGQLFSYSVFRWDTDRQRWEGGSFECEECNWNPGRYEYGYDLNGNQIASYAFEWWGFEIGWSVKSRTENDFDDYGNKVSSTGSWWDQTKQKWLLSSAQEFGYNESGRITSHVYYFRDSANTTWIPREQIQFSYDDDGRIIRQITDDWNTDLRNWVHVVREEWLYDSNGLIYVNSRWSKADTAYSWKEVTRRKTIKEFDSQGNLVLITDMDMVSGNRWSLVKEEERAYNASGQIILSVIRRGLGTLSEEFRTEWEYSQDGRLILEIKTGQMARFPGPLSIKSKYKVFRSFDEEGDFEKEIWYNWDYETQSYVFTSTDFYYYHPVTSGIPETASDNLVVYPNPTNGAVYFNGLAKPAEVKIYSIQGVLLRSFNHVEISVDLSDLPSGMYLMHVTEDYHSLLRTTLVKE